VNAKEPIRVDLSYPRMGDSPDTIIVELEDVRAADALIITYDFARDGWRIGMDQTRHADDDGGHNIETVAENQEVAFIPAWNVTD